MNTAITAAHNQANSAYGAANTGGGPKIASIVYPGNDTAANNIGGQTVYLTGSGFYSNSSIYINGNSVPATSFISASNIGFTTPNLTNGIYPIYLVNYDGATAIKVPGIVISGEPSWNTAAGSLSSSQAADGAWSYSLSANGDAPITYALASGSTLPTGVSLNANGVISGTISSPPGVDTTYTFSVVASDAQNQDATRQFSVTATVGEGVLFANNVLLLHADGTNNGNNHAFVDSSNNNFTITRNGNATQGTFSPFSQTGWSGYFDGTGDYLTIASNTALTLGTSDFTIEFWWYPIQFSSDGELFGARNGSSLCFAMYTFGSNGSLAAYAGSGAASWDIVSNLNMGTAIRHTWNHIAFTRSGNTFRTYLNGTQISSTTASGSLGGTTVQISGRDANGTAMAPQSYISNCRILKGTAAYTGSTYTIPTAPFTAVANTSLLTLQSNRFIDNSTNAFTITKNGDVSIQAFSPFAPTAAYTTANVGGSAYFDGTGDNVGATLTGQAPGTGNFTYEVWVYPLSVSNFTLWNTRSADTSDGFSVGIGSGTIYVGYANQNFITGSNAMLTNAWTHIAVVRNSGTITLYVNGINSGSAAKSDNFTSTTFYCGGWPTYGATLTGYLSSYRYVNGTAVYTTNFTPPTAPFTAISGTQLLLNFTNAQIFDQTAKNVLECVGDAKVSTSVYKYGSGSISFDGNGDYLNIPPTPQFNFGSGNYTIEFWIYLNSTGTQGVLHTSNFANDTPGGVYIRIVPTGLVEYAMSSDDTFGTRVMATSSVGISTSTWTHVACVRNGNTMTVYINGTSRGTNTFSGSAYFSSSYNTRIGYWRDLDTSYLNAYIDDLRITMGYARYTSNFTPPTSAFPNK